MLCLWLPNWPIQRLVVAQPELKGHAITLYRQDPRRGQLVAACSSIASRSGIRTGMPLSEAKSLTEKQLGKNELELTPAESGSAKANSAKVDFANQQNIRAFFLPHDPESDLETLESLADECEIFSPIVGLEQTEEPTCIYLDITGLARLFASSPAGPNDSGRGPLSWEYQRRGEANLASQIMEYFLGKGYWPCISIAPTIGLAWALKNETLSVTKENSPRKSVNKQPEEDRKPNTASQRIIIFPQLSNWRETQNHPAFAGLPVTRLRISNISITNLHQLGVLQLYQLLQLPRSGLTTRFGEELIKRIDQATGRTDEVIVARHKPPEFQREQLLDHPTGHWETIDTIIWQQLSKVCRDLAQQQQGALQVQCRLVCDSQFQSAEDSYERGFAKRRSSKSHFKKGQAKSGKRFLPQSSSLPAAPNDERFTQKQFAVIQVGLFQPTAVPEHLVELLRMQLENLQLPGLVYEVRITIPQSSRLVETQRQLFDENPRDNPVALAQFINRLGVRLGEENVLGFTLSSGAQPEFAFQYHRLASRLRRHRKVTRETPARKKRPNQKNNSNVAGNSIATTNPYAHLRQALPDKQTNGVRPLDRPLQMLPQPVPLETLSVTDGPPACFNWQGEQHQITTSWGPERIQTGWWRGPMAERDYWRVEAESGIRFWIFRDLKNNSWYLHGFF